MRCTQRLPLFLSVLALPVIMLTGAVAQKNIKKENLDVEPWQLRAHGHNHLDKVYQEISLDLRKKATSAEAGKKTTEEATPKKVQKNKKTTEEATPKKVQKSKKTTEEATPKKVQKSKKTIEEAIPKKVQKSKKATEEATLSKKVQKSKKTTEEATPKKAQKSKKTAEKATPKKVQKSNKKLKVQTPKVNGDSGRAFAQAVVNEELKAYGEFEPELWQLRAHGHHHNLQLLMTQPQQLKKKQQNKVTKKAVQKTPKKTSKSDKKEKREIQEYEQQPKQQQKVLAASDEDEDEVDIAHDHKHKSSSGKKHHKHKNHEEEEHDKYDVDPADELADEYMKNHGGKAADDKEGDKKDGKAPKEGKDGKEGNDGMAPKDGKDGKAAPNDGKNGKAAPNDGKDGKAAPNDGKDAGKAPADAKSPADGKVPVAGKPAVGATPPAPAGGKPAPIIPVQHMGEFLTKCNTPGQVAMTFSEGPSEATTQMLEILKEAKARVTFFANATWLEYMQYAGITRRAYMDGHLIGMTYRIPNDSSKGMTDAQLRADIAKQASKIHDLIGQYPKYVRLHDAGLQDSKLQPAMRDMGYTLVGFNLDQADYKFNTREQAPQIAAIYDSTFTKQLDAFGRKGSYVVVGYDIPSSGAAAALPDIVSAVIRNDYDMVRLDGCNNDKTPYKKSALLNDGFVGDEFSFGAAKYVHGQSPVAVQNGKAVPGKMPAKVSEKTSAASSLSATSVTTAFAIVLAAVLAL